MRKWQNAGMPSRRGARVALRACLCACLLWCHSRSRRAAPASATPWSSAARPAARSTRNSTTPGAPRSSPRSRKPSSIPPITSSCSRRRNQAASARRRARTCVSAMATLRARATKDDVVLVLLIGHGTAENDEAKFNLVGPDLSALEWADLVRPIAGRLVFIDTASGSFPFLRAPGGTRPRRPDGERFSGAAVRDGLSRLLHQGVRGRQRRSRQERQGVDLGSVRRCEPRRSTAGTRNTASWPPSVRSSTTPATAWDAKPTAPARTDRWRR